MRGFFLHLPFCAHGQVTPNPNKLVVAGLGNPLYGPLKVTCPFLQYWTNEHQRNTWNTFTPTDTQPIARKATYLWTNLNLTRSLASPSPTLGAIYTMETQPMARESYTSSTLGGTYSPHRGGVLPPLSPLHYESKEQVQFWSTPNRPLLLMINAALQLLRREVL